jgi:hypothetical protein
VTESTRFDAATRLMVRPSSSAHALTSATQRNVRLAGLGVDDSPSQLIYLMLIAEVVTLPTVRPTA